MQPSPHSKSMIHWKRSIITQPPRNISYTILFIATLISKKTKKTSKIHLVVCTRVWHHHFYNHWLDWKDHRSIFSWTKVCLGWSRVLHHSRQSMAPNSSTLAHSPSNLWRPLHPCFLVMSLVQGPGRSALSWPWGFGCSHWFPFEWFFLSMQRLLYSCTYFSILMQVFCALSSFKKTRNDLNAPSDLAECRWIIALVKVLVTTIYHSFMALMCLVECQFSIIPLGRCTSEF